MIPGEDGQLIQASNEVPAGCDVPGYEDGEAEDGERVHRIATSLGIACRDGVSNAKRIWSVGSFEGRGDRLSNVWRRAMSVYNGPAGEGRVSSSGTALVVWCNEMEKRGREGANLEEQALEFDRGRSVDQSKATGLRGQIEARSGQSQGPVGCGTLIVMWWRPGFQGGISL